MPGDTTTEKVLEKVRQLNADPEIDGILVQLPLPKQVDAERVIAAVSPAKDADGFHPENLGLLFSGRPRFTPCTPTGIMTLLAEYKIPVAGARAVVAGRSIDVGRPMAALLTNADATVTICHSKTKDLPGELKRADILVSAIGKAHFIQPEMVKPGAVVIDVGINQLERETGGRRGLCRGERDRLGYHTRPRRSRPDDDCYPDGEHVPGCEGEGMRQCTINKITIGGDAPSA